MPTLTNVATHVAEITNLPQPAMLLWTLEEAEVADIAFGVAGNPRAATTEISDAHVGDLLGRARTVYRLAPRVFVDYVDAMHQPDAEGEFLCSGGATRCLHGVPEV